MSRAVKIRCGWLAVLLMVVAAVGACATIPPGTDFPRTESVALADPLQTRLGSHFDSLAQLRTGASGFHLLTLGVDGFLARAQIIDAAEKTLDLQYFIFRGDDTGRLLTDGLVRAADRGVRVRVLVDDGDTLPGDEQILALTTNPRIEIRVFNPWVYRGHNRLHRVVEYLLSMARLDYRMHNKLLVADNSIALVGGRNIGNQYFQVDPTSQFADDDVFAAGPIVRVLSATFDEYWNSRLSIPAAALGRRGAASRSVASQRARASWHPAALVRPSESGDSEYTTRIATGEPYASLLDGRLPLIWSSARVFCDSPDKKQVDEGLLPGRLMVPEVRQAIASAHSEFLMVTPYFIPADEERQTLRRLRDNNITVGVVTNSLESSLDLAAFAGYTHFRKGLLRDGVSVYEVRAQPGRSRGSGQSLRLSRFGHYGLHGKLMVFDRESVFIGSMNFDQRSRHLNTEMGLLITSPELAEQTAARFGAMSRPESAYSLSLQSRGGSHRSHIVWHTLEQSAAVDYTVEPAPNSWRRMLVRLLALLPLSREL